MNHFRFPALSALLLSTAIAVLPASAAETNPGDAMGGTAVRTAIQRLRPFRPIQPNRQRGAAGREYARKQQMKKDQAKAAKDIAAARKDQAKKDAEAFKDAEADAKTPAPNPQSRKISPNILKGGLGKDDLDTLDKRVQSLDDLQKSLTKGEGKISREELNSFIDAVGLATQSLWAARQATGASQATYRLGGNALVKGEFATKLFSGELTRAEARQVTRDFRQLLMDEKDLVTADSTPESQAKTQGRYGETLSKYFEARE
jgi:hypothetical protein